MDDLTGRLLVVDDDEGNRDMLSRRLQRDGFVVGVASDGPEAMAAVARQPFDLVLLDIEMPGMNGFEVLRHLRDKHPATQLPVIIATARHDRKDIVAALEMGANDFVTKPLDFAVVMARVRTQLSHKLAVDRIISLESDLRRRNDDLERANARMLRSLDLASRMQQSLLPASPLRVPGLNFAWVYEPCDELGGDILNVFPLGPNHVGLYLLDVSGHGVPAALLSVTLSRILAIVPGQPSLVEQRGENGLEPRSPRSVVDELNSRFPSAGAYLQYFTLFYAVLDVPRRRMTYISAGHPPSLYVPAQGEPRFLNDCGFAVGWFPDAEYVECTLDLHDGDRLYLYSDGCTETMNASSVQFGREHLAESLVGSRPAALQQSLALLLEQMKRFRGDATILDDVSALGLEITGDKS